MTLSYMKKPKVKLTNSKELADQLRDYCTLNGITQAALSIQCFGEGKRNYITNNLIAKHYRNDESCKKINEKTGLHLVPKFEIV